VEEYVLKAKAEKAQPSSQNKNFRIFALNPRIPKPALLLRETAPRFPTGCPHPDLSNPGFPDVNL